MFTDSKKQMIKLVIAITILIFVLVIVGILMIKYEVEGETNMPFKLSKVIVVGTVEGVENGESDKKWDFSIFQNNDIHFYIDQNAEKSQNLLIKSVKIDNINLKFVPKRVDVKVEDIYLLQILDAIKDIKKIPATTPSQSFVYLKNLIEKESSENQIKLTKYAKKYTPRTKALLGAILKELGNNECAYELKDSLNALTTFKLDISSEIIKDKKYWNIV